MIDWLYNFVSFRITFWGDTLPNPGCLPGISEDDILVSMFSLLGDET